MALVFNADFRQGQFVEKVNQVVPVNTGPVVIKNTEKGRAAYFDGSANLNYGQIAATEIQDYTIAIIEKVSTTGTFEPILTNGYDYATEKGIFIRWLSTDKITVYNGQDNVQFTPGTRGEWNLHIFTKEGTECKLYTNNALVDTLAFASATINYNTDGLIIGTSDWGDYDGVIPSICMYNHILTTRERELLYQEFLHSYPIQKPVINVAKLRPVATFDGVDDRINCGDIDDIRSISIWVLADSAILDNGWHRIISKEVSWFLGIYDNKFHALQGNGVGWVAPSPVTTTFTSTTVINDIWYHVVLVYDGNTMEIFINGISDGSVAAGNPGDNNLNIIIGYQVVQEWQGRIDDVRIFPRALSLSEIQQLYRIGKSKGDEVGHWKLNEGSGLIAYDSSGNDNHGAITNAVGNDFWQQTRGKLAANDVFVQEDLTNQNAEGITTAAGKFLGDWKVATGSFRCKEDSTGKYIDCVTNGTIQLRGIDLSELVGNGYIKELEGDLSGDADGTVDDATNLSFANNILTVSMTAGQVLRKLIITRGA